MSEEIAYPQLTLTVADAAGLAWAQERIVEQHYLHTPVDSRCRPLAYIVHHQARWGAAAAAGPRAIAILIFGRPEATCCYTGGLTYGSQADIAAGRAQFDRWEILNLARVWAHPYFQHGGLYCSADDGLPGFVDRRGVWRSALASWMINQALDSIRRDYLLHYPPCFLNEPYQLRACLSYCDTRRHTGTIYRASGFARARTNADGIETYWRVLPSLTAEEDAEIQQRSLQSERARRYRAARETQEEQLTLF